MRKKHRRIGILGGTFNPVHLGHLALADAAKEKLQLEQVIFVPAKLPPHKKKNKLVSADQRYQMLVLAIKSNPAFKLSACELRRGGLSYSVDTVRTFKSIFPKAELYFIVGSDFLEDFSQWKDIVKLGQVCCFVVAQRPGYPWGRPGARPRLPRGLRVLKLTLNALNISSTDIRRRIKTKQSVRYLVPEAVRRYILKKRLYH